MFHFPRALDVSNVKSVLHIKQLQIIEAQGKYSVRHWGMDRDNIGNLKTNFESGPSGSISTMQIKYLMLL